jgi:hypothetical protein
MNFWGVPFTTRATPDGSALTYPLSSVGRAGGKFQGEGEKARRQHPSTFFLRKTRFFREYYVD